MIYKASAYSDLSRKRIKNYFGKGLKSYFKFLILHFASAFGKLFFFSFPFFSQSEYKMVKSIQDTGELGFVHAFEDETNTPRTKAMSQFALYNVALTLVMVLILGAISFGLIQFGMAADVRYRFPFYYLTAVFDVLCGAMFLVFFLWRHLFIAPAIYLLNSEPEMTLNQVFQKTSKFISSGGRQPLLHLLTRYFGFTLLFGVVGAGIIYWTYFMEFWPHWIILDTFAIVFFFLLIYARNVLAYKVATNLLFEDLKKDYDFSLELEAQAADPEVKMSTAAEMLLDFFNVVPKSDVAEVVELETSEEALSTEEAIPPMEETIQPVEEIFKPVEVNFVPEPVVEEGFVQEEIILEEEK